MKELFMKTESIVLSFFAVLWWDAGLQHSDWSPIVTIGIPIAVLAFLFLIGKKESETPSKRSKQESRRIRRLVGIASGIEVILIIIAVNILMKVGKPELISPIIAIIVGLHFFPLARWKPQKLYYYTGLVLIGTGTVGTFISEADLRLKIVCIVSALTLWITTYILLRRQSVK